VSEAPQGDGSHLGTGSVQAALNRANAALTASQELCLRQARRIVALESALREVCVPAERAIKVLEGGTP
jgi:hypothetical protein